MPAADPTIIKSPARIEALLSYCLLDSPADPAFDRLTALAAHILNVPVALVSLVDADRQFFKSQVGLKPPMSETRQLPLSHSFCQHVVVSSEPLIVEDTRLHPLLYDNPAIRDQNVIAYAGIPLVASTGDVLGSFCIIDHQPRQWSERDIYILTELAASVMTEIELRSEISERHRVEKALQESESLYRSVIMSLDEGVVLHDRDGRILTCNPAAERIIGVKQDDLAGYVQLPGWSIIRENETAFPQEEFPAILAAKRGEPHPHTVMGIQSPENELKWLLVSAQPLVGLGDSSPYAVVSVFVDITERRHAEKQELLLRLEQERMKLLAQFIRDSSHEFRTPLAIIQSSIYLMLRLEDPEKRQRRVAIIEEQIASITRLLDILQKLTQIESEMTICREPIFLTEIVHEVANYFAYRAGQQGVEICLDLLAESPVILGNHEYLKDALWQVVDNAVRFTPTGGCITIYTECRDETAAIIVEDTGVGIPQNALSRIFERFFRLDTAHRTPGFGLGLSLAETIIKRHDGEIGVYSQLGMGTTVVIALPLHNMPQVLVPFPEADLHSV